MDNSDDVGDEQLTLVTRKACFGLPTACPSCLPVYLCLRFSDTPFNTSFNLINPHSDQIPHVENGTYVAYNNDNGGLIGKLKDDGILDLDSELHAIPEWLSMKAMVTSWLADALLYELWIGSGGDSAHKIYYSDLPWPIGKILFFKKLYDVKQSLRITNENAERREHEIYKRAAMAYAVLSTRLGEQTFFFTDRPTSLDAVFLGHALLILLALPETSVLRSKFLEHDTLVKYAENLKTQFLEATSSSSVPSFKSKSSSSMPRRSASNWSSKAKSRLKKEKSEEQKTFKRRAKYFLMTQLVVVLVFLSLGGYDQDDLEFEDD